MLRSGHFSGVVLQTAGLPDGITPTSPKHAEPVTLLDAGLRFKLEFSEWRAAVGSSRALDLLENVQFGHRHSFLGFRTLDWGAHITPFSADAQDSL